MNVNQRIALLAIVTAALVALLLGRYTLIQAPGDAAFVYRLNRLTGGVVYCAAGSNKDGTTGCQ